jgi:hypothetical protein
MDIVLNVSAIVLTLMVLSRIVGDNPLFRIAQYIFIGSSLGIALVVSYHQVLRPSVIQATNGDQNNLVLYGIPLLLGLLFLPRITRRQQLSWLANIPLALVFGVGAALAVAGAIAGTLVPQIVDTARLRGLDLGQLIGGAVLLFGTIITLSSFYFTVSPEDRNARLYSRVAVVGHWLLMIAFGFFFAGAVQTYLSALAGRLSDLVTFIGSFVGLR